MHPFSRRPTFITSNIKSGVSWVGRTLRRSPVRDLPPAAHSISCEVRAGCLGKAAGKGTALQPALQRWTGRTLKHFFLLASQECSCFAASEVGGSVYSASVITLLSVTSQIPCWKWLHDVIIYTVINSNTHAIISTVFLFVNTNPNVFPGTESLS